MTRRALPLVALALLGLAGSPLDADVIRSSTGQRRVDLDKMELQPFPADAWGKIAAWGGGDPITPASIAEKPVLIVTWASWHPGSRRGLTLAQRMLDKYGPQGLVVVGIHHAKGWDAAEKTAKDLGLKFPYGHDANGEFRSALKIVHDPDYYIIDRAGHLRYAAVSQGSVEEAVEEVTNESPAQANDLPRILKERAEEAAAQGRRTTDIRSNINLASLPPVPPGYSDPPETAYKAATWPKVDEALGREFGLVDQSGRRLEPKLNFSPQGYYPSKPETQGRAMVIYFWHPDVYATYNRVMTQMDLLQQQYSRDLAVIGAMVPVGRLDSSRANNDPNAQEDAEKLQQKYRQFINARNFKHALAADLQGTSLGSLSGGFGGSNKPPIPGAMVVSSDGVIRWVGLTNTSDFKYAVDTVLANDPGVRARRQADQRFIESAPK